MFTVYFYWLTKMLVQATQNLTLYNAFSLGCYYIAFLLIDTLGNDNLNPKQAPHEIPIPISHMPFTNCWQPDAFLGHCHYQIED